MGMLRTSSSGIHKKATFQKMQQKRIFRVYKNLQLSLKNKTVVETIQRKDPNDQDPYEMYNFIKRRIENVGVLIGDRTHPSNRRKGTAGLILWIFNLVVHFSFDFYEAYNIFHPSWATAIALYLVTFIICTTFMIKHTLGWYTTLIHYMSKKGTYLSMVKNIVLFFKYLPMLLVMGAFGGAVGQYGCYAADGAATITFYKISHNGTRIQSDIGVMDGFVVLMNILRFTSLLHIYYFMFLILLITVIVHYTLASSQTAFNEQIKTQLKAHPPSITFQDAVNQFSSRCEILLKASKMTTVVSVSIILATSISFIVNAYNYLFIKRYAIYVWFAVAPLLWCVTPLVGAAMVTSAFQDLKYVVMHAWVEIPDKYDRNWARAEQRKQKTIAQKDGKKQSNDNKRDAIVSKTIDDDIDPGIKQRNALRFVRKGFHRRRNKVSELACTSLPFDIDITRVTDRDKETNLDPSSLQQNTNYKTMNGDSENKSKNSFKGIATTVKNVKSIGTPKNFQTFNYEKYLRYLNLTLDDVGFCIGNVNITWDRVSFFMAVLTSLVGIFAQSAILKA